MLIEMPGIMPLIVSVQSQQHRKGVEDKCRVLCVGVRPQRRQTIGKEKRLVKKICIWGSMFTKCSQKN